MPKANSCIVKEEKRAIYYMLADATDNAASHGSRRFSGASRDGFCLEPGFYPLRPAARAGCQRVGFDGAVRAGARWSRETGCFLFLTACGLLQTASRASARRRG